MLILLSLKMINSSKELSKNLGRLYGYLFYISQEDFLSTYQIKG
ncbi:MAG: hypothetical protein ACPLN0_01135 [Candidatus Hydrothermia bacterium]